MKFKIDENLPVEIAELLQSADYDAVTVIDQGLKGQDDLRVVEVCHEEGRILMTFDLDFADVYTYPPQQFPGFMVLRLRRQDKHHVIRAVRRIIPLMEREPLEHHLWIIEENRVRIWGGGDK